MKAIEQVMEAFRRDGEVEDFTIWQVLGSLFVVATLSLAGKSPLLLSAGLIGLYLAARSKKTHALLAVAVLSLMQQMLLTESHLWFLGLETSLGCALFITALGFEGCARFVSALITQADAHVASIQNLEEELALERESAQSGQIQSQENISQIQKELEEIQSELSSLNILNEVLRKTAVRHTEEKNGLEEISLNQQRRMAALQADLIAVERELERLSHPESLAEQNRTLLNEINAARLQREQTQLINETLVRLHAKESLKAKETAGLQRMLDQVMQEKETLRSSVEKLETVQTANQLLEERLRASAEEIERLQVPVKEEGPASAMLAQLREQFEEKNKVLHETRSELFHTDVALQTARLEKEQLLLQVGAIPGEVQKDLERLESEGACLKEEVQLLEEIVTSLSLKKK